MKTLAAFVLAPAALVLLVDGRTISLKFNVTALPIWGICLSKLLICLLAATLCGCAFLMSGRKDEEEKHRQMVYRMDNAHVFITTGDFPKTKPYQVLGDLKYSEPFSTDAIDTARIERQLKAMALAQYPDRADAVIKVNSDVESSGETTTVTVTGEVIQFESSADRELMHKMWDDMSHNPVVSPK